jgi:succinate dehydrogenase/fumarate reductase-like Fe-S protein
MHGSTLETGVPLATREGADTGTRQRVQEVSAAGDENRRCQRVTADINEAPDGLRTASAVQHLGKEVGKLTACNVKKARMGVVTRTGC